MPLSKTLELIQKGLDLIKREKPDNLAVAFDLGGSVDRVEIFKEYKANRHETPDPIKIAVPYIHNILKAMGSPILMKSGYEADDIIGTIAKKAKEKNKIAIIHVEGAIVTGGIDFNSAGSDGIVKNINKARDDENVKGIILRVNSPGGDVYASSMITNALEEFQSTGRPVITSMGDIAASGGVWVATTSEEIWAEDTTLTGSIGVYSIVPDVSPLENWVGINYDGVSMTKAGDIYDLRRGMNKELNKQYRENTENFYKEFVTRVANNRDMDFSEVLKFAGGRIWRGDKAVELGLVDKLGSLDDAIESMAKKLEIEDYKVFSYETEVEFEFDLNLLIQNKLPYHFQDLLNEISGLNRMFLSKKKRYVVAYCFDCGFENFE